MSHRSRSSAIPAGMIVFAALATTVPTVPHAQDRVSTVDLVQAQLTVPAKVTPGKRFIVLDTVENAGEMGAPMTVTGFCLAKGETCGATDLKLAARRVPALAPGASHAGESPVMLPDSVEPGRYYLVVTANANNDVQERTRANNIRASALDVTPKK